MVSKRVFILTICFLGYLVYPSDLLSGGNDGCLFSPAEINNKRGDSGGCGDPTSGIIINFDQFGIDRSDRVLIPKNRSRSRFAITVVDGDLPPSEEIRFLELSELKPVGDSLRYPDDTKIIYFMSIRPEPPGALNEYLNDKFLLSLYWQEITPVGDLVLRKADQSLTIRNNKSYDLDIQWRQRYLPGSVYGSIEIRLTDNETGSSTSLNQYGIPFTMNSLALASSFFVGVLDRVEPDARSSGVLILNNRLGK